MKLWHEAFRRGLAESSSEPQLYTHIDDLLDWYVSSKSGESYDTFWAELVQVYEEPELRVRYERAIERLIFHGNEVLDGLFAKSGSPEKAKRRYRKLMQVFHPDIGQNQQAWLTSRSEKLNRAYQGYKSGLQVNTASRESVSYAKPQQASAPRKRSVNASWFDNLALRYDARVWRRRLGDPENLRKRLTVVLLGIACIVLTLVFLA